MKRLFSSLLCLFALAVLTAGAAEVSSPGGAVKVVFTLDGTTPTYTVSFRGKTVIKPSRLGYELANAENLLDGFTLAGEETSTFDEIWKPVWGENSTIRNHYNELLVRLVQTKTDRYMNIRFRVYDEGVGLRYEFPQEGKLNYFTVKEERTEFAMTGNHTAWWIPGDYDTQEYEYTRSRLADIRGLLQKAVSGNMSQTIVTDTAVQT